MRTKKRSLRPRLAVGGVLLLVPFICGAVTPTFEKIADLTTVMPEGFGAMDRPFVTFTAGVSLDAGTVTFSGRNDLNRSGIYRRFTGPLSPLQPVATEALLALPPVGAFRFNDFIHFSTDGGTAAFSASFTGAGFSVGLVKGPSGGLSMVASSADPMPGYAATFGSFDDVSLSNGQAVWRSQSGNGSNETGVYSDLGGVHAVALPGDPVPGFPGGTFTSLANFGGVAVDGADIVFSANSSSPTVFSRSGIYMKSGANLSMIVDTNMACPGSPQETFATGERVALHQGAIAFVGGCRFPNSLLRVGVYSTFGGLHTVADTHTTAPGTGTPFTDFADNFGAGGGGLSIHKGIVAFVGYTGPASQRVAGIYLESGNGLEKFLAAGDVLGGRTVADLRLRHESLDTNPLGGLSLAFWVRFTDFSQSIYRADFAKPVRHAVALPDVSSNGIADVAMLRQGSIRVEIRDGVAGAPVRTMIFLSNAYAPVAAAALPDSDSNGFPEFAVLARRIADGRPVVEVRNISNTPAPRDIWFGADSDPIAMSVIAGDADNNGVAEIAMLSARHSDGRGRVDVKNAFGPANANTIWVDAGLIPRDLDVVEDRDGNGVPEIAILSARRSDGRPVVEIVNAYGTPNRNTFYFMSDSTAVDLAAIGDADNNLAPEVAVLSRRNSDGRGVVEVKNAAGATNPRSLWVAAGHTPLALAVVADADGNTVPELATLSTRDTDGRTLVEILNAAGAINRSQLWYSAGFTPRSVIVLDDLDGNGVPEAAVVMIRNSDGRILVQSKNAAGPPSGTDYWYSP